MALIRLSFIRTGALLLALGGMALADDQPGVRAALQSPKERKLAPEFALEDAAGKTVKLKGYRGKVVLLDFWATWCTGCKKEIPMVHRLPEQVRREALGGCRGVTG